MASSETATEIIYAYVLQLLAESEKKNANVGAHHHAVHLNGSYLYVHVHVHVYALTPLELVNGLLMFLETQFKPKYFLFFEL